jgi:formylglycine-generating enzyme required for sulfatase activity
MRLRKKMKQARQANGGLPIGRAAVVGLTLIILFILGGICIDSEFSKQKQNNLTAELTQVQATEPASDPQEPETLSPTHTTTFAATADVSSAEPQAEIVDQAGVPMVFVPAGKFTRGSKDGARDEGPEKIIYLDDYYIDKYEVTNARYAACVQAGMCTQPFGTSSVTREDYFNNPEFADYPVIFVSWNDANLYCQWREARLPSEAEWEKAARGSEELTFPWGNAISTGRANYNNITGDTSAVGSYPDGASPFGIMDMAGNVWEWVADWYDASYYLEIKLINPNGPAEGEDRVLRGGSWSSSWDYIRTTKRLNIYPENKTSSAGFRCANLRKKSGQAYLLVAA